MTQGYWIETAEYSAQPDFTLLLMLAFAVLGLALFMVGFYLQFKRFQRSIQDPFERNETPYQMAVLDVKGDCRICAGEFCRVHGYKKCECTPTQRHYTEATRKELECQ